MPVKDAQALAGAMTRYLSLDADAKAAMGHASRTMAVERFDISHVIAEYEKVVGQCMQKTIDTKSIGQKLKDIG